MKKEKQLTVHFEEIQRLKRIEGQIKGLQKMILEQRYCIDILIQLSAAIGALKKVQRSILNKHLEGCVKNAFLNKNNSDSNQKIDEIIKIMKKL